MERKYSIDVLRVISAVAVVIIHIVSAPITNNTAEANIELIKCLKLIHTFMKWSVPIFFMITGYCMLKKREVTYEYCFKQVCKFVGVLFTVGFFYALLEEVFSTRSIKFSTFTQSLLNVVSGNLWDHMWYVYATIGIYLVMPVIHLFLKKDKHNALILTTLLFAFNILIPTFEEVISIGVMFPFGGYLFYVCFGGVIAEYEIDKKCRFITYLLGLASIVWVCLGIEHQTFGYAHLAVCAVATSIFLIVVRLDIKPQKFLLCFSQCTWGIYLIHPLYINIIIKVLKVNVLSSGTYIKLSILLLVVLSASFVTTYIIRKIPLVKKLF